MALGNGLAYGLGISFIDWEPITKSARHEQTKKLIPVTKQLKHPNLQDQINLGCVGRKLSQFRFHSYLESALSKPL